MTGQATRRWYLGALLAVALMIGFSIAVLLTQGETAGYVAGVATLVAVVAGTAYFGRRARFAPEAAIARRAPVAAAIGAAEYRRARMAEASWGQAAAAGLLLAALLASQIWLPGRHPMPRWVIAGEAILFAGAFAWFAWAKLDLARSRRR